MIFVIFHHYFPFQSNSNFMINDFVFISWNQTDKGVSSICDHFVTVQIFPLFFIWQKIWQKIILSHMVMQRSKLSETTRLVLPLLLKCFRKSCFCLEYKKSFTYVHCTSINVSSVVEFQRWRGYKKARNVARNAQRKPLYFVNTIANV